MPGRCDDPVGDLRREDEVVSDDERGALLGLRTQQRRELELPLGVHAAGRLVEHEEVGLGHEHRRQPEALSLAAGQVTGCRSSKPASRQAQEQTSTLEIAADAERDLIVHPLGDDVAADPGSGTPRGLPPSLAFRRLEETRWRAWRASSSRTVRA